MPSSTCASVPKNTRKMDSTNSVTVMRSDASGWSSRTQRGLAARRGTGSGTGAGMGGVAVTAVDIMWFLSAFTCTRGVRSCLRSRSILAAPNARRLIRETYRAQQLLEPVLLSGHGFFGTGQFEIPDVRLAHQDHRQHPLLRPRQIDVVRLRVRDLDLSEILGQLVDGRQANLLAAPAVDVVKQPSATAHRREREIRLLFAFADQIRLQDQAELRFFARLPDPTGRRFVLRRNQLHRPPLHARRLVAADLIRFFAARQSH